MKEKDEKAPIVVDGVTYDRIGTCPCGSKVYAVADDVNSIVLHGTPTCPDFDSRDALEFVIDRKSGYSGKTKGDEPEAMAVKKMQLLAEQMAAVTGGKMWTVPVHGSPRVLAEALRKQPWAHLRTPQ